jgi:hypothetical protein
VSKKKFAKKSTTAEEAAAEEAVVEASGWWYCLESRHPGATEVIHDARFFQPSPDTTGPCPVCPACGREVAAVPVEGEGVYPSSLLALADRLV